MKMISTIALTLIISSGLAMATPTTVVKNTKASKTIESTKVVAKNLTTGEDANLPSMELIENYIHASVIPNPEVEVDDIKVFQVQDVPGFKNWRALFLEIAITFNEKSIVVQDIVFVNKDNTLFSPAIVGANGGENFKKTLKPTVPADLYNEKHLIAGNINAKHKVLVFSDPVCPYCRNEVPNMIKMVQDNPDDIALFYYHNPLSHLHKVSDIYVRVMEVAKMSGRMDVFMEMYKINMQKDEKDIDKVLALVEKKTGFKITKEQILSKEVTTAMKEDSHASGRMMVMGTPTLFVDGVWDKGRQGINKIVKKKQ